MDFKREIAKLIEKESGSIIDEAKISELLEVPPKPELGDFAFPCFIFAKELKKAPNQIAAEFAPKINSSFLESSTSQGPYVNFKLKKDVLAKEVLSKISEDVKIEVEKKDTICLESPGPNTNKPLHVGHLRNMLLGVALRNILKKVGHNVVPVDIVNDRGIHICKSMLAYKKWGEGKTPSSEKKKGDFFVGEYYVRYAQELKNNPNLEKEAQKMLVKWEEKDPQTRALWKKMREWCAKGFAESYKNFGVEIKKAYYESDHYEKGKEIVVENEKKGLFKKDDDGSIFVDFKDKSLGKKILLRADGTSIYITQDIYLGKLRFEDWKMDRMIYIVGNEQIHHFKVLFEIFKMLKFPFAKKCFHLAYGMVSVPGGKLKSREGATVDADNFLIDMLALAKKEVKERYTDLSEDEINTRADIIGRGALNFFMMKFDAMKDFVYDSDKSLSFQGETGPYVQYAHARICSIIRKANVSIKDADYSKLDNELERNLVNLLGKYEETVLYAADNYKPSVVPTYLIELSQLFNRYYHEVQVIVEDKELMNARLFLLDKIRIILKDGLALLNIKSPEAM